MVQTFQDIAKVSLPAWAKLRLDKGGNLKPSYRGCAQVDVHDEGMYEAWLKELAEHYAENGPPDFLDQEQVDKLIAGDYDQYWLEVAYQCGKMELQICMRTFNFDLHIHSPTKKYALRNHPKGRGVEMASGKVGQLTGGREARQHFKKLRGFLPA